MKNNRNCLAITTQSDKGTIDSPMTVVDEVRKYIMDINYTHKAETDKLVTNSDIEK